MIMVLLRDRVNRLIGRKVEDSSCWDYQSQFRFYIELAEGLEPPKRPKKREYSSISRLPSNKDLKFEMFSNAESLNQSENLQISKQR